MGLARGTRRTCYSIHAGIWTMRTRCRFKQVISFQDRVASFATEVREKAERMPPGQEREDMLKKACRADIACHLDEWARSPVGRRADIRPDVSLIICCLDVATRALCEPPLRSFQPSPRGREVRSW